MARRTFYIGIDDTDAADSIGTGALGRELRLYLVRTMGASCRGITRHVLCQDPSIPFDRRNSAVCVGVEIDTTGDKLMDVVCGFLEQLYHDGADPGVCIAEGKHLPSGLIALARRITREPITQEDVLTPAVMSRVAIHKLGGRGDGIIGAFAACALRIGGDDGTFIALEGLHGISGRHTVAALLASTAITTIVDAAGTPLPDTAEITLEGWIKPELSQGRIVLRVAGEPGTYHVSDT